MNDINQKNILYDYLIARLACVYGSRFTDNYSHLNENLMRATWMDVLGKSLNSKEVIDYAIENLELKHGIPSAICIRDLCSQFRKPIERVIEKPKTEQEIIEIKKAREEALKRIQTTISESNLIVRKNIRKITRLL